MDRAPRSRWWIVAIAALAILTFARVLLVDSLGDQGYFGKYLILADQWRSGDAPAERFADISLAYLVVIAGLRDFLDPNGIRTMQVILTSIAALFCGIAAYRLRNAIAGCAAAIIVLGSRSVLVNATEIEPETMILVAVAAFLALFPFDEQRIGMTFAAGVAAGLAMALRPTFALPLALVLVWLSARRDPERPKRERDSRIRHAIVLGTGAALTVLPFLSLRGEGAGGGRISMNPGTVFYEGMNPWATGYTGVQPRVVNDLEPIIGQPDSLHIAYRYVASRALENDASPELANAYWTRKAVAWARDHPLEALELTLSKLGFSVHGHDSWDLVTMVRKERELSFLPWVSLGLVFPIAVVGLFQLRRRELLPLLLLLGGQIAVMVMFYVSARQRNSLWPILAVAAGCALATGFRWFRRRRWIHFVGTALILLPFFSVLTRAWSPQREDHYAWTALLESQRHWNAAAAARQAGNNPAAAAHLAHDRLWLDEADELAPAVPMLVTRLAERELPSELSPARRFDIAVGLASVGSLDRADEILETLEGYQPQRGNILPASVGWQRAKIALRRGDREEASRWIDEARQDAPGTPEIEAAASLLRGASAEEVRSELEEWLDPFTVELALARVLRLLDREDEARERLEALVIELPEWPRPRQLVGSGEL